MFAVYVPNHFVYKPEVLIDQLFTFMNLGVIVGYNYEKIDNFSGMVTIL